jgi:molybdate transport system substrate-binding protein
MVRFLPRRPWRTPGLALLVMLATVSGSLPGLAAEAKVAVAANFTEAVKEIGALYEKATGNKVVFTFGATGQLYTQITQDAPFDVFLAADQKRPKKAVDEGYAVADTLFTYATGKLVLFSKNKDLVQGEDTLKQAKFEKVAIANPKTAPYGAAAVEVMKGLGVYEALAPKIVQGNSISQTFQFVGTGTAEVGFIALSQVVNKDVGSRWIVPEKLYATIAQDAVLLKRGANNEAAKAFVTFLNGPEARAVKEKYGYGVGITTGAVEKKVAPAQ